MGGTGGACGTGGVAGIDGAGVLAACGGTVGVAGTGGCWEGIAGVPIAGAGAAEGVGSAPMALKAVSALMPPTISSS